MFIGRAKVITKGLNFRSGPGTEYPTYGTLFLGDELDVIEDLIGWLHVSLSGREGYISSNPKYVAFTRRHTEEADLVTVSTPYPTSRPVLLHPRAAADFEKALSSPGLSESDVKALCQINSSFRSWNSQLALIRDYEIAIGEPWKPWKSLTEAQRMAARNSPRRFAYHPGNPPVDAPHTHVGGGALDISGPLPARAKAALEANHFRMDSPGDSVHWGWHET